MSSNCSRLFSAGLIVCLISFGSAAQKLGRYNVDPNGVTVSGISSGGAMATQFHVAFSDVVQGAGIVAGIPYHCAKGNMLYTTYCMTIPSMVDVDDMISDAHKFENANDIDPLANLADDRIYIYHSTLDTTVNIGAGRHVEDFYSKFLLAGQIKFESSVASSHGHPTDGYGDPCYTFLSSTYVLDCSYNAAFEMMDFFYGGLDSPSSTASGQLTTFDQGDFTSGSPSSISLDDKGYVYVPTNCVSGDNTCKLHVAFHGCQQGAATVGDVYVKHAGYLEVAEANDIIVLFPQVKASIFSPSNPMGCWDWWGYDDGLFADAYATKSGPQMAAVFKMVQNLMSS